MENSVEKVVEDLPSKPDENLELFKVYEDCYREGRKWIVRAIENSFKEWDKGFILGGRVKTLSEFIKHRLENYSEVSNIIRENKLADKDKNKILDELVMQAINEFSAWKAKEIADKQLVVYCAEAKIPVNDIKYVDTVLINTHENGLIFNWKVEYRIENNENFKFDIIVELDEQMTGGIAKKV